MPLCVTGMHRSGTSMIVRLLHLCGLHLGRARDLLPPAPDNPEGFWENRAFLRLNDALLTHRGGRWDLPPPDDAGWEDEPSLQPLQARAGRLLRPFRGCEPWGWKDPRNCLTLPFWKRLLPDLKVLICVRHPVAVAESLWARDGLSSAQAFDLWQTYYCSALTAAPADRVITHYDSYFRDPRAELRRVLGALGIAAGEDRLEQACATIRPALAHHRTTRDEPGGPAELANCYRVLCTEAGFVGQVFCLPHEGGVRGG